MGWGVENKLVATTISTDRKRPEVGVGLSAGKDYPLKTHRFNTESFRLVEEIVMRSDKLKEQ